MAYEYNFTHHEVAAMISGVFLPTLPKQIYDYSKERSEHDHQMYLQV